jgi:hypothetical protein
MGWGGVGWGGVGWSEEWVCYRVDAVLMVE